MQRNGIHYSIRLNHWLPRLLHHDATTVGHTICVADATIPAQLHCHEFQHVRQFHEHPWTFWVSYLWACRLGYPKAPRYDTGNPYEVAAYAVQLNPVDVATFSEYAVTG